MKDVWKGGIRGRNMITMVIRIGFMVLWEIGIGVGQHGNCTELLRTLLMRVQKTK